MNTYLISTKSKFQAIITHFNEDIQTLRTGRATPALVENIIVDIYGNRLPIKQLASITVPESRQLLLQPWDKSGIKDIEKAIADSSLSVSVVNEGTLLRLTVPVLTEETRLELIKLLGKKLESARVSLRQVREDIKTAILQAEKLKEISEDERYRFIEELDKTVSEYTEMLGDVSGKKEVEIKTV